MTNTHTVEAAIVALAADDTDGARLANGIGFNGRDTVFGRSLAQRIASGRGLSPAQRAAAYRMLRTYRGQLARGGIDYDQIPAPEAVVANTVTGAARMDGGDAIVVTFSGFPGGLVQPVKDVPGARWHPTLKEWRVPFTSATPGYLVTWPEAIAIGEDVRERIRALLRAQEQTAEASRATSADIDLDFAYDLMPFQRAGVAYAATHRRVLIGDEMGLGKTVQALATLEIEDAYPALVIVPAVVKLNWIRETERWLPARRAVVLEGRSPYPIDTDADLVVINYDLVDAWRDTLTRYAWKAMIADESHYLKNAKAKRTKGVKALAGQIPVRLLLTGTPVLNRPIELAAQLDVLGRLGEFGGFMGFAKRYCGAYQGRFGWDFTGATNLTELHDRLRSVCMVRRTKDQVLSELPAKRRVSLPMEMTDRERYRRTERELKDWLAERMLADRRWREKIEMMGDVPEAEVQDAAREKERRMGRARELVKIEALKQVAAQEKLAAAGTWIEDFLASGKKLVVFATHRDIVAALAERFIGAGVVTLTGDTSPADRQAVVDRFQADPACRLFIGNTQAAGVGITLTEASDVAFVELPWRPGDLTQAEDRCHRIGQQNSVTAWYLLAAGTIEERIAGMLDAKRAVVDEATDGKAGLDPQDSLLEALVASLMKENTDDE